MPITSVKSPDGRIIKVQHPEGASQQEIISYAQQNYSAPQSEAPSLADQRASVAGGMTLQPFGIETGIELPQWAAEGLAGMGRRMSEIGTLGTHKADPVADKLLDDSIPATVGGIAADVGAIMAGGGALQTAKALPYVGKGLAAAGQALSAPQSLGRGVVAAGAYGGATDPNRVSGAVGGALGQGVGYGATKLAGKVASPYIKKSAQEIMDAGGTLTPGEMMGGSTQRAEDALTSMPVLGDAIKGAKKRSLEAFNKKTVNEALAPIGQALDDKIPAGRSAIAKADDLISNEYDEILGNMNVKMDGAFAQEVSKLRAMAKSLPARERRKFEQVVTEKVLAPFDNPNRILLGKTFKEVDSGLRNEYKRFLKSSDPWAQDVGDALRSVHQSMLNMAKRQNPQMAERLSKADQAYAKMYRISEAANYKGAVDGIFTPDHLLNAAKKTTSKKQYAAGKGFDQQSLEAAKDMLAPTVPDSGTAGRAITNLAITGGLGYVNPAAAMSVLGMAGLYTQPGQRIMTPILGGGQAWRAPLRKGLERSAPYIGILGTGTGVQVAQ